MKIKFLIVSYGSRQEILSKTLSSLQSSDLEVEIFIHLNSPDESLTRYSTEKADFVYVSNNNIGSAGGFKNLIDNSRVNNNCDFYILLDDDNFISKKSMFNIKNTLLKLDKYRIYGMYRTNRKSHRDLIENGIDYSIFKVNSAFSKNLQYLLHKLSNKKHEPKYEANYGIYGGLVISNKVISEIDSPDEKLVLYHDDYDFTRKAVKKLNKPIKYIPELKIDDIETNPNRSFFDITKSKTIDSIAYFAIRNPIKTCLRHDCKSKFMFLLNCLTYIFILTLYCLFLSDLGLKKRFTRIKILLIGFGDAFKKKSLFSKI
tara:strand:+ start:10232 stop:11179 length:948 start_codon:yes stop_codon:yes gene_type:complete